MQQILKKFLRAALPFCFGATVAAAPHDTAQKVLDELYAAQGNFNFKKPKLVIATDNQKGAAYNPAKNTIFLDAKTYRICAAQGRDSLAALAFVLGHEMAHAFQSEIRHNRLKTNFLAYDQHYHADIRTEKTADVQGVFNAYLAGYKVLGIVPTILENIYKEYGLLGKKLNGYPTLEERQASGKEVLQLAETLLENFESAGYLTAIGQYGLAASCYEFVLQYYQGREVFNNLGLVYALQAQETWDPAADNFLYPFEADWSSKLDRAASRGNQTLENPVLRLQVLGKAEASFREALRLDPDYFPAKINLVCILDMQGKAREALQFFNKNIQAKKGKKTQQQGLAEIALAITYLLLPGEMRQSEASDLLEKNKQSSFPACAFYAAQNLDLIRKTKSAANASASHLPMPDKVRQVLKSLEIGKTAGLARQPLDAEEALFFAIKRSAETTVSVFSRESDNLVSLARCENRQLRSLSVSQSGENLAQPIYRNLVAARDGFYLKFEKDKAILKVDANGRVLEMVKFVEH